MFGLYMVGVFAEVRSSVMNDILQVVEEIQIGQATVWANVRCRGTLV